MTAPALNKSQINEVAQKLQPQVANTLNKSVDAKLASHNGKLRDYVNSKLANASRSDLEDSKIEAGLSLVRDLVQTMDQPTARFINPRETPVLLAHQRETGGPDLVAVPPLDSSSLTPVSSPTSGECAYMSTLLPGHLFNQTATQWGQKNFAVNAIMTAVPTGLTINGLSARALAGTLFFDGGGLMNPIGRRSTTSGSYEPWFAITDGITSTNNFNFTVTALDPEMVGPIEVAVSNFSMQTTTAPGVSNGSVIHLSPIALDQGISFLIRSQDNTNLLGARFKVRFQYPAAMSVPTVCWANMKSFASNLVDDATVLRSCVESVQAVITINPNANLTGGWSQHATAPAFPALTWLASTDLFTAIRETPTKKKAYQNLVGTSHFLIPPKPKMRAADQLFDSPMTFGMFRQMDYNTAYGTGRFTTNITANSTFLTASNKPSRAYTPGPDAFWAKALLCKGETIFENPDHKEKLRGIQKKIREHVEGEGAPQLSFKELLKQKVLTPDNARKLVKGAVDLGELIL